MHSKLSTIKKNVDETYNRMSRANLTLLQTSFSLQQK